MYKTTAWQGSPHPLKTINAPCETMSCQTRTKDPNLQTDSKFPVGDGVGSLLTEQPHCYVSGEKGALNQPGAGWVSQVHSQVDILSHFRILALRSDIIHSIWFGNRSENLCRSSTLTKPHTFCGIPHYHHLSDLVEITCFYGLNETSSWWKCCFGWIVGDERAAESGVCTGQVGVLCPQAQVRTST